MTNKGLVVRHQNQIRHHYHPEKENLALPDISVSASDLKGDVPVIINSQPVL